MNEAFPLTCAGCCTEWYLTDRSYGYPEFCPDCRHGRPVSAPKPGPILISLPVDRPRPCPVCGERHVGTCACLLCGERHQGVCPPVPRCTWCGARCEGAPNSSAAARVVCEECARNPPPVDVLPRARRRVF